MRPFFFFGSSPIDDSIDTQLKTLYQQYLCFGDWSACPEPSVYFYKTIFETLLVRISALKLTACCKCFNFLKFFPCVIMRGRHLSHMKYRSHTSCSSHDLKSPSMYCVYQVFLPSKTCLFYHWWYVVSHKFKYFSTVD